MKQRLYAILGALVFVFGVSLIATTVAPNSVHAQQNSNSTSPPADTTCTVEMLGWIVCPFLEVTSKAADSSFNLLANNLLQVDDKLISNDNKGTFAAWSTFRDLANVAFVGAFLFLIYSQITGMGASNYGIKKMLPRLIIAAILVNASYYICQVIVDLTNILGFALKDFLWKIAQQSGSEHALGYDGGAAAGAGGNGTGGQSTAGKYALETIAIGILGAAAVFAMLGMLASVVLAVIVTCLVIVIILLLRKAIIVLLIVISPLAFVAYLLPNTEKYFSKWMSMFWQLLLVFPIVSLLFGAGQLASTIILNASAGGNGQGQAADASAGLIAAGIAVAPLMAVYSVLKGALAAAGAINGAVNAMGAKAMGSAGKWAKDRDANSALARGRAMRKQLKQEYKDDKFYERLQGGHGGAYGRYTRAAAGGLPAVASRISAGKDKTVADRFGSLNAQNVGMARVAAGKLEKATAEQVAGAAAEQRAKDGSIPAVGQMLSNAIKNGDVIGAKAAEDMLMNMGGAGVDEFAKTIARTENDKETFEKSKDLLKGLKAYTMQQHAGVKDKSAGAFEWAKDSGGKMTMVQHFQDYGSYSGLSDKQRASQSSESFKAMSYALDQNQNSPTFGESVLSARDATGKTGEQRLRESKAADDIGGTQRGIMDGGGVTGTKPPTDGSADKEILHR